MGLPLEVKKMLPLSLGGGNPAPSGMYDSLTVDPGRFHSALMYIHCKSPFFTRQTNIY